jgi:hypothetical protein
LGGGGKSDVVLVPKEDDPVCGVVVDAAAPETGAEAAGTEESTGRVALSMLFVMIAMDFAIYFVKGMNVDQG